MGGGRVLPRDRYGSRCVKGVVLLLRSVERSQDVVRENARVHGQDEGRKCRLRLHHAEGGLSRSRSGSTCHQDVGARVNHTRRIGYGWLHCCMDLVLELATPTVTLT